MMFRLRTIQAIAVSVSLVLLAGCAGQRIPRYKGNAPPPMPDYDVEDYDPEDPDLFPKDAAAPDIPLPTEMEEEEADKALRRARGETLPREDALYFEPEIQGYEIDQEPRPVPDPAGDVLYGSSGADGIGSAGAAIPAPAAPAASSAGPAY